MLVERRESLREESAIRFQKLDKPVIDEKVISLPAQRLPDIRLLPILSVQRDVLRQPLCQQGVKALCLLPLVVDDHVGHVPQTLILQFLAQAIQSAQVKDAKTL